MKKICIPLILALGMLSTHIPVSAESFAAASAQALNAEKNNSAAAVKAPVLTVSNIDSETNKLSWKKVTGAKSYILYVLNEETGKYRKIAEIEKTSCRHKNLKPNTKYTYRVAAKLADGTITAASKPVSIYTANKYGNSFNYALQDNIYFGTFTAVQGEWLYFSVKPVRSLLSNSELYKIKTDGTEIQHLKTAPQISYINVIGDKIYYISDDHTDYTSFIMSCDLDGNNEKVILHGRDLDEENWFYFYLRDLKIIDDRMIFTADASSTWDGTKYLFEYDLKKGEITVPQKLVDPQTKWLYTNEEQLYLCDSPDEIHRIADFDSERQSALLHEDIVYYTENKNIKKYENNTRRSIYSCNKEYANILICYADKNQIIFLQQSAAKDTDKSLSELYSISPYGSDLKLLWSSKD